MNIIMKHELIGYLKRPILWVGIVVLFLGIYQSLAPYLSIHYFESETELKEVHSKMIEEDSSNDADIMQDMIPAGKEKQFAMGLEEIKHVFIKEFGQTKAQAEEIINDIEEKNMKISEITLYLEENYSYYGANNFFYRNELFAGNLKEVNQYIEQKTNEHPYSYYFARKFADFAGLFMGFFATIFLAFLFIWDTKRDIYELLHTKPVPAVSYICGKIAGGFLAILFVLGILLLSFGVLCAIQGKSAGFPVNTFDILWASILYIVPNMLMITCVYTGTAILFKNPLPAVPILFAYLVYSNMGSIGTDGIYGYYGKPLAIMVRFPGFFFEIAPPPMVWMNQFFLLAASTVLSLLSICLWKRRRVY